MNRRQNQTNPIGHRSPVIGSPRRLLLGAAALSLAAASACPRICAAGAPVPAPAAPHFIASVPHAANPIAFAHDYVLGTSMELLLAQTSKTQAALTHDRVLAEIDRLASILSTRDPHSTIRRFMATGLSDAPEIAQLLNLYSLWSARTGGIISPHFGGLIALWKTAHLTNQPPTQSQIDNALAQLAAGDRELLNIDALGKAFVIDRAAAIARQSAPAGLINIGGDITAWGDLDWQIGVADPRNPAENAPLFAQFELRNASAATSGGYMRNFTLAGKQFSHLLDARTGQPIEPMNAATVIANDCVTANALSTAASVLGSDLGAQLARLAGARGFLVAENRGIQTAGNWTKLPAPDANAALPGSNWPTGFQVTINVNLKSPGGGRRAKRPYVAVWVEDTAGKVVKTVTLWGTQQKYLKDMRAWVRATNGGDRKAIDSVGRASRSPGQYTIAWDGTDNNGKPLARGKYTIVMEVNREHGRDVVERTEIACADKPAKATMKATFESDESSIEFGPKKAN